MDSRNIGEHQDITKIFSIQIGFGNKIKLIEIIKSVISREFAYQT